MTRFGTSTEHWFSVHLSGISGRGSYPCAAFSRRFWSGVGFLARLWKPCPPPRDEFNYLFLLNSIPYPIESHIECFGEFWAHEYSKDDFCSGVVSYKRCSYGWMGVTKFNSGNVDRSGTSDAHIYATVIWFRAGGNDNFYCVTHDIDRCISNGFGDFWKTVAKNEPCCRSTSGFRKYNICSIWFDIEDKVTGIEMEDAIWVCDKVIRYKAWFGFGVVGWCILVGSSFVESWFDAGVDFRVVEECYSNLLDTEGCRIFKESSG